MAGVFACPECGRELEVEDDSPGREVQCEACSTWVEVPYLPRGAGWKRGRLPGRRSPWDSNLLRGAIAFASVALLALIATRTIGGRIRSDQEKVLAELLASADRAEASSRYDVALRELEAALARARAIDREGSGRLSELDARRDRVSLLEAEGRLARVDRLDPDQAVGESLTIAERARRDPALAPLAEAIEARLDGSRRRQAQADLEIARKAFDSGKDAPAFAAAERLHDRAGHLSGSEARRFQDQAEEILGAAVGRSGVALPPIAGRFVAGPPESYTASLDRLRVDALRARGYLPRPRRSPWAKLWDEKAPFRLTARVVESQSGFYFESKNRTTEIDGTFELASEDGLAWDARVVGQTRVPLPDLPAYIAGHLGTAGERHPEAERRLRDDAFAQFAEQAARKLRGLPGREAASRLP